MTTEIMRGQRLVRLIIGYTGTGKDTIGEHLNRGKGRYNWVIYRDPSRPIKFPWGPGFRVAFADEVKRQVKEELNLVNSFDIEKQKNEIVKNERTFRSFCIEKGCGERKRDPYYWCRIAFDRIEKEDLPGIPTVTDCRFYEEIDYPQSVGEVVSIRVFRKDVPIPPVTVPNDDPEHTLDKYRTDFLVVPKHNHEEEIDAAKKLFPQYQDYCYFEDIQDYYDEPLTKC